MSLAAARAIEFAPPRGQMPLTYRSRAVGIAGCLVLLAAMAKVHAAWGGSDISLVATGNVQPIFWGFIELMFGVIVLLFRASDLALIATASLFTAFLVYHLLLLVRDTDSCNCFGAAPVRPLLVMVLDLSILGMIVLSSSRIRRTPVVASVHDAMAALAIAIIGVVALNWWTAPNAPLPHAFPNMVQILDNGRTNANQLSLAGKRLPFDIFPPCLGSGNWLVMLSREGCSACETELPQFLMLSMGRKAVLSLNAPGKRPSWASADKSVDARPIWFCVAPAVTLPVTTPCYLTVSDGIVLQEHKALADVLANTSPKKPTSPQNQRP